MFDKLIQLFFEKTSNNKTKGKVLTIEKRQNEKTKKESLCVKNKIKDKKEATSLSKYFENINGLLGAKNDQANLLNSRKSRLQSRDFYQE